MPTFERGSAVIHYTDTGAPAGGPHAATAFFGHGLLFGGWMFRTQITALRDRYRCVAIDWRGQGDSAAASGGYDMDTLTDDATGLISLLDVGPVHYVGLSMGGFVGQRLAARRRELVRTLTLLGTSATAEDPDQARRYRLMAGIYRMTGIAPLRSTVQSLIFGPAFLADPGNKPITDEWARRLRRCHRSAISKAVRAVAARTGVEHEIKAITAPTLVVVGADDRAIPPRESQRIATQINGTRLVQIPDCGHSSALEQPATIAALLTEFLDSQ